MTHNPINIDLIGALTSLDRRQRVPKLDEQQESELSAVIRFYYQRGIPLENLAIRLQERPDVLVYDASDGSCVAYECTRMFGKGMRVDDQMSLVRIRRQFLCDVRAWLEEYTFTGRVNISFRDPFVQNNGKVNVKQMEQVYADSAKLVADKIFQSRDAFDEFLPAYVLGIAGSFIDNVHVHRCKDIFVGASFAGWELELDSNKLQVQLIKKVGKADTYMDRLTMEYNGQAHQASEIHLLIYSEMDSPFGIISYNSVRNVVKDLICERKFKSIYLMPAWSDMVPLY
jgi:hypothetical protein